MTDVNPNTCTAVTIYFEGHEHQKAAHDFVIQYSDGGLDQHFEGMFLNIDRYLNLDTSDFDSGKLTVTLKFDETEVE